MKKVLVTGASGFVGRHTIAPLIKEGFEVHALAREIPPPGFVDADCTWHSADFLSQGEAERILGEVKPDCFLHLAWDVTHREYWESPKNKDWIRASAVWAREFLRCGGLRWVSAGTCAEYKWDGTTCREDNEALPDALYGQSKLQMGLDLAQIFKHQVSHAWGRLFFLYGPGEDSKRLVPEAIQTLLDEKVFVCDSGECWRDFLYVEDAGKALVKILMHVMDGPINIGSGKKVKISTLIEEVGRQLDKKSLIKFRKKKTQSTPELIPDVHRIFKDVGWRPEVSLEEGIARAINWWRDKRTIE